MTLAAAQDARHTASRPAAAGASIGASAATVVGPQAEPAPAPAPASLYATLETLLEKASTIRAARDRLAEAAAVASGHEGDPAVCFILLQLKERAGQHAGLAEQWKIQLDAHPEDLGIFRFYMRRLVRDQHSDEALALIDQRFPDAIEDADASFARAEMLGDIQAYDASDELFKRVIEVHDRREARISFAKRLRRRGLIADAHAVMLPIAPGLQPTSKAAELASDLADEYAFFCRFETEAALAGQNIKPVAMVHAIKYFTKRELCTVPPGQSASLIAGLPAGQPARLSASGPARIALLTGNLGAGGAERQLSRLAEQLHQRGAAIAGASRMRPPYIEVIVKQHGRAEGSGDGLRNDFFLDVLLDAGVPVTEINNLPAISAAHQGYGDPALLRLLAHLPPQVHYGVTRLAPYLRERAFDVVSLWQDGTCLFGALAALLAGVPVIHLVFRGLPPNIRQERFRPEYAALYRALADVPGVQFVSNSHAAALEYARWLELPLERFRILYNGVPPIETIGAAEDEGKWAEFAAATVDASETIGGVFRLESDKRPLLWIRLAHRYLKRRPAARFVIVGNGRLQPKSLELAQELGIADRILFVGHSSHVGFWYSKMDVKVLLSRFEGLPNVLIEAQLVGVRTVSTPAGGAGECFIDGDTGHLLASAENPDLDEACDKIFELAARARAEGAMSRPSVLRASTLFSVDAVVSTFQALCTVERGGADGHAVPAEVVA